MIQLAEFVTHDEYEGRERLCDERFARDKHQIDENRTMLQVAHYEEPKLIKDCKSFSAGKLHWA